MIKYINGDLLSATKGVIVHGCNCKGVMGSGVALAIRNTYAKAYLDYLEFVNQYGPGKPLLGMVQLVPVSKELTVANAFTQNSYGRDSHTRYVSYEAVDQVFMELAQLVNETTPIHNPKIGSGLGGGDWNIISERLAIRLPNHDITVYSL